MVIGGYFNKELNQEAVWLFKSFLDVACGLVIL